MAQYHFKKLRAVLDLFEFAGFELFQERILLRGCQSCERLAESCIAVAFQRLETAAVARQLWLMRIGQRLVGIVDCSGFDRSRGIGCRHNTPSDRFEQLKLVSATGSEGGAYLVGSAPPESSSAKLKAAPAVTPRARNCLMNSRRLMSLAKYLVTRSSADMKISLPFLMEFCT